MSNKRQVRHVVTLSELQIKEVIVMNDGKRLGHISDLEIDGDNGRITALVIMAKEKKSGFFGKSDELIIPWNYIEVIGTDVILVKEVKTPSLYTEQKLLE
ncbi:YlmC/YmxH family sporulation protein [Lentibacillus sp.]|uniref:YlmC/YmxH family sporulation protein n=1 Tax=Lentibacillus sp. TaxID=1925746 RepID=UPI0039C965C0